MRHPNHVLVLTAKSIVQRQSGNIEFDGIERARSAFGNDQGFTIRSAKGAIGYLRARNLDRTDLFSL